MVFRVNISLIIFLCIVLFESCTERSNEKNNDTTATSFISPDSSEIEIKKEPLSLNSAGKQVVKCLKLKDFSKLADFVHSKIPLKFSPYGSIDPGKNKSFSKEAVVNLSSDTTRYVWGNFDGSGEEMRLNFEEYFRRFIYDKDYIKAPAVAIDKILKEGNSKINLKEVIPNARFVEYHFPGQDPQYQGMDWSSLRLVFEEKEGKYYLIYIVHDQWTI